MDTVLEFISDNYFWIILIAVILLMALIGYIAEQQGFGNGQKVPKEKKPKKEKKEKIQEIKPVEAVQEQPIVMEQEVTPEIVQEQSIEEVVDSINESPTISEEAVPQTVEQPVEEKTEEDLYAPLGDTEVRPTNDLNIDRDFNNVLEDVEETADEADIELPNMDSVEPEELEEDEDIWKF